MKTRLKNNILLTALSFLVISAQCSWATGFAVLLQCGSGGCGSDDRLEVKNPLYEPGKQRQNPLFEPQSFVFSPIQFADSRNVTMRFAMEDTISVDVVPPTPGSYVFELSLFDPLTGQPITQFLTPVDIGFRSPFLDGLAKEKAVHPELALHYLNTSVSPPQWEVLPHAVTTKVGSYLCGKTDHLSIFAFGPLPEPSSMALMFSSTVLLLRRI